MRRRFRVPFTVKSAFSEIRAEDAIDNMMNAYGASNRDASTVIRYIIGGDDMPLGIKMMKRKDYEDFLKTFFPLRTTREVGFKTGYTINELANIIRSPWWMGNMSGVKFNELLEKKGNKNMAFVRLSTREKGSFVIGADTGAGAQVWKYPQEFNVIVAEGHEWRTIQQLYEAWSEARGLITQRNRFTNDAIPSRVDTFTKTITGKMDETIEASTESNYVNMIDFFSS